VTERKHSEGVKTEARLAGQIQDVKDLESFLVNETCALLEIALY
jgi:hypothetical protein